MAFRSAAALLFLVLGSLFTIPASVAVWQERTLLNEDRFVQTVSDVLDDETVQTAVASRMADAVMVRLDVSNRIDSAIVKLDEAPATEKAPGLTVLEGPIVSFAREAVFRVCLRIVQSDIGSNARELVLRTVHRSFMALVQNDGEYLKATGGRVVLDLRPLIDDAIREVASDRAADVVSEKLGSDSGQIVLVEGRDESVVWRLLGWLDDLDPLIPLITVALLFIAVLLAHNRLRMVGIIGGSLIVTSGLALFVANSPLKDLTTSWPPRQEGQDAAAAAYDVLLSSFRRQELFVSLIGVGLVAFSVVARRPDALRKIRTELSRVDGAESSGFRSWAVERLTVLRAAGLALGSLVLLLLPDLTPRVFGAVIAMVAVYLGALWVVASDSPIAESLRGWVGRTVRPTFRRDPADSSNWIARWSGTLRLIGLVAGAAVLLLAPDLSLRLMVLTAAGVLLYLALVDYLASRTRA